jgi:hypothetical protein
MKTKEIKKFREDYKDYTKECVFEGYKLAVHFDEKDAVKRLGGRWDAGAEHWWMPAKQLKEDAEPLGGPPNGSLVIDVLNANHMIMGQYGEIKNPERFSDDNDHYTEYGLHKSNNEPQFKVQFFYEHDVAKFIPTGMGELATEYLTLEDGRKRWDKAIASGYNRVENS